MDDVTREARWLISAGSTKVMADTFCEVFNALHFFYGRNFQSKNCRPVRLTTHLNSKSSQKDVSEHTFFSLPFLLFLGISFRLPPCAAAHGFFFFLPPLFFRQAKTPFLGKNTCRPLLAGKLSDSLPAGRLEHIFLSQHLVDCSLTITE